MLKYICDVCETEIDGTPLTVTLEGTSVGGVRHVHVEHGDDLMSGETSLGDLFLTD